MITQPLNTAVNHDEAQGFPIADQQWSGFVQPTKFFDRKPLGLPMPLALGIGALILVGIGFGVYKLVKH